MKFLYRLGKNFICMLGFLITFLAVVSLIVKSLDYLSKLIPVENHVAVFFGFLFIFASLCGALFKTLSDN